MKDEKKPVRRRRTVQEAFDDWEHDHRPNLYWVERKAFKAGWIAALRSKWAKEQND